MLKVERRYRVVRTPPRFGRRTRRLSGVEPFFVMAIVAKIAVPGDLNKSRPGAFSARMFRGRTWMPKHVSMIADAPLARTGGGGLELRDSTIERASPRELTLAGRPETADDALAELVKSGCAFAAYP